MKRGGKLWCFLSVIFIATLIIMITFFYGVTTVQTIKEVRKNQEQALLAAGEQPAIEPNVIGALKDSHYSDELETYMVRLGEIYQLDFIVIVNMQRIRLTHPDHQKTGKHFEGGDEVRTLKGGEHLSVSQGSLGESLRGFVPVYDQGKQIGVVAMSIKTTSLSQLIERAKNDYTVSVLLGVGSGFILAIVVSYYLKKQFHDLEPKETARLLEERNAIPEETKDTILVIDTDQNILLANIEATKMYHNVTNSKENLLEKKLSALVLSPEKSVVRSKTGQFYRQNNQDYFVSIVPVNVRKRTIGHVIFLKNAAETFVVAEQLVSTTIYVSALQSQSREFMNKTRAIHGLVDLEDYEALKHYLADLLKPEKEFAQRLAILVRNPILAGFLSGEKIKFAEIKTQLAIEIYPEIPPNKRDEDTQNLIAIYHYICRSLMGQPLPGEIIETIDYQPGSLTTAYSFAYPKEQLERFKQGFSTFYLARLLENVGATLTWENQQNNRSVLRINVHCEGAEENEPTDY